MTHDKPRSCNAFARLLGKLVLKLAGWRLKGEVPASRDMVIIAAPHTSNWDFILLMAAAYSFGLSINWLGKASLFPPVLGTFLKYLGGIPIDRSRRLNMVEQLTERVAEGTGTTLVVPPSGTRKKTDHWKSGFYRIAEAARIPIVCGYLDYARKEAGLGPAFIPSDLSADMDRLRAFYDPITPRFPERKSIIRLKDEDG